MAFRILIAIQSLILVNVYCAPRTAPRLDNDFQRAAVEPISTAGCGSTKGCILIPQGCDPKTTCNITLTYAKQNNNVRFEISIMRPPESEDFYAAVGFNSEPAMANASVIACIYTASSGTATASLYHNPAKKGDVNHAASEKVSFRPADPAMVRLEETGLLNNLLICRYTRTISVPANKLDQVWPLNAAYNILLARGHYNLKFETLTQHFERVINPGLVDVTQPPRPN